MIADFTIHIHDLRKPTAVRVIVHDNLRALRSAATQHTNIWQGRRKKRKHGDFKDTCGICHRFHRDSDPVVAIVRLASPYLGIGVVAHELAHAAVWIREIEAKFDELPLTCENDEQFCWLLGELTRQTVNKLYEKGVWSDATETVEGSTRSSRKNQS